MASSARVQVLISTYKASDMCGAPATDIGFRSPGFLHTALLDGLKPNAEYFYQLGDAAPRSESPVLSFFAPPSPDAQNVEFVIFGDLGQVETDGSNEASEMDGSILTTTALAKDLQQGIVRLNASAAVFHIGDISYARGFVSIWEQFFRSAALPAARGQWSLLCGADPAPLLVSFLVQPNREHVAASPVDDGGWESREGLPGLGLSVDGH